MPMAITFLSVVVVLLYHDKFGVATYRFHDQDCSNECVEFQRIYLVDGESKEEALVV